MAIILSIIKTMTMYERCDLTFTGLNFLIFLFTTIVGVYVKIKKKSIDKDKKEIDSISKEIKKYKDTIINNKNLTSLSIVSEQLNNITKEINDLIHKEQTNQTRGMNIFNAYADYSRKILDIKCKIPSKYKNIENKLDQVKARIDNQIKTKIMLSNDDESNSFIYLKLQEIIHDLKVSIEKLNLK